MLIFAMTYLMLFLIFIALIRITYLVLMDDSSPSEKKRIITFKSFFNL